MLRTLLTHALIFSFVALSSTAQRPGPREPADASMRLAAAARRLDMEATSPFRGLAWRCIGPIVQGGRVVDIEAVPGEAFSFLVAYASGGLWRTDNNGHTFEPLFDEQPTLIMGDIAVDPFEPDRIWVGTGENNSSRSSYGGLGVFRSDDGGKSWSHMGLGETDRIGRILVDPRDSDRVYVAALGSLYRENRHRGVYRTTDGGASWKRVLPGDAVTGFIDLAIDPQDPDVVYAAAWDRSRRPWNFVESGEGTGVWKSEDGGDTWRFLAGLPGGPFAGRIGLAVAPSSPGTVYVSIDNQEPLPEEDWDLGGAAVSPKRLRTMTRAEFLEQDPDDVESFLRGNDIETAIDAEELIRRVREGELTLEDILAELDDANASLFATDIRGVEVWRSNDAGFSWRRTHEEPIRQVVHTYGYYFGQIRVSPDDADRLFIMGVPMVTSHDGGATWSSLHQPDVHVDHHALWIDPDHPDHMILGNDGGIDITYDRGATWRKVDAQPVGQFYTVAVDMKKPYNVYGGTQDNGTLKGSSRTVPGVSGEWSFVGGGDGMHVQVDVRDDTVYYGYQFGHYFRRDSKGSRSIRVRDAIGEPSLRYNWSSPILLSPHNGDIVYFGANRLFRSMDRGDTWKPLSPDLSTSPERGDVPFATITSVAESELEFGVIWVGTDDGNLWLTRDGGRTWNRVDAQLPEDRWISRVEASRVDVERAYVSLTGYRDDDTAAYVFRTDDGGATWKDIAAGLPRAAINTIREDPTTPEVLYVGTDSGVFVSRDGGAGWESLNAGLPPVPVHDVVVHPRDRELVAATHGRSMWVIDALPIQESIELEDTAVEVFPVEKRNFSRGWKSRRSPWFDRPATRPEQKIPFWSRDGGGAVLTIRDGDDRVLRRVEMEATPGVNVFAWDLLLDDELAVAAEKERVGDPPAEDSDEREGWREKIPWAESVRLGRPVFVTPGSYVLHVAVGSGNGSTKFEVEKPSKRTPRTKPPLKIRGR